MYVHIENGGRNEPPTATHFNIYIHMYIYICMYIHAAPYIYICIYIYMLYDVTVKSFEDRWQEQAAN